MIAATHNESATGLARKARSRKRATRTGVVTSTSRDKTIRVMIQYLVRHPKYGKYLRRRTILHAHDEKNECASGDKVELMACRPLSKTKHWRLVRIIEATPREKVGEA